MNTEVIIIGAGPSGLTAAKILAENGIKTIVLERAAKPGTKSSYSGIFSKELLERVFGKFNIEYERTLSECRAYLLQEDTFVSVNQRNNNEKRFIALRETVNSWMLNKAKSTGAEIVQKTVVRDLIVQDGKIIGVKTDEEEYFTSAVIVAEGVSPMLTKTSGLRKGELTSDQIMLFTEETINLHSDVIETRFNLKPGIGLAGKFFVQFNSLNNINCSGYIYTNKNSISLGTGIALSDSVSKGVNINECQEKIKLHPAISPLIKDGITINYASYMLPCNKGDLSCLKIFSDGCLIVGGAAMLVNPFEWDVSLLPIISGELAARTVIKAKQNNDFSSKTLSSYEKELRKIQEFKDLQNQKCIETTQELSPYIFKGNK